MIKGNMKYRSHKVEQKIKFAIKFAGRMLEKRVSLNNVCLFNPFVPNAPFLYPLKTSFLMFSEGRERVHCERIG